MGSSRDKFERIFTPESSKGWMTPLLKVLGDEIRKDKPEAVAPKDAMETGSLTDDEAAKIAESNAFRRNMFLSPMAFARKSLSTSQGRSVLNV
ncbi:MAG: hypothetical protein EOL91_08245 [Actinobacteria bacterium]|nr:hypothetical protein [Actinomycetota bacterium]